MATKGASPTSSILLADMKLILYHEDWRTELYDLSHDDAAETTDLSQLSAFAPTVSRCPLSFPAAASAAACHLCVANGDAVCTVHVRAHSDVVCGVSLTLG